MPKTIVAAQRRRGKVVRRKLETILTKIQVLIAEQDSADQKTNDAENLLGCLTNAKLQLEEAAEYYTTFI